MLNIAEMHQTQMYVYFRVVQLPRRDGTTLLPYFRLNCMSTLVPDNSAQKRSWFFFLPGTVEFHYNAAHRNMKLR